MYINRLLRPSKFPIPLLSGTKPHTILPLISSSRNMSTQKAVVCASKGVSELRSDVPLPKLPADNWLLVKTKAVALNPTDWKSIEWSTAPGALAGCDYAGIVEEVGKAVTNYKVGDRIAGFVRGGKDTIVDSERWLLTYLR